MSDKKQRISRVRFREPVDRPGEYDSTINIMTASDYALTEVEHPTLGAGISVRRTIDGKPVAGEELFVPIGNVRYVDYVGGV